MTDKYLRSRPHGPESSWKLETEHIYGDTHIDDLEASQQRHCRRPAPIPAVLHGFVAVLVSHWLGMSVHIVCNRHDTNGRL